MCAPNLQLMCETIIGRKDPNYGCECSTHENGIDRVASCVDSGCQLCLQDGDDCHTQSYTWLVDGTNDLTTRYEFLTGVEAGTVLDLYMIDPYTLSIDGQECTSAYYALCANGDERWRFDCTNIREGLQFDACKNDESDISPLFQWFQPGSYYDYLPLQPGFNCSEYFGSRTYRPGFGEAGILITL